MAEERTDDVVAELDTSAAPLLRVHFHGGDNDAQLRAHLDEVTAALSRRSVMVFVTSPRMPFVTPNQAGMYVRWLLEHEELVRTNFLGLALVLRSALARGAFKAISSMAPLACPWETFATEAEAVAWARQRLAEARDSAPHVSA